MKSSEECIGGITFNITQDDVNAFAAIGVSFYVSDPMDVVNGGKLYFVPPKNFSYADSPFAQHQNTRVDVNNPTSDQDGTMFVPIRRHWKMVYGILTQIFKCQKQNIRQSV